MKKIVYASAALVSVIGAVDVSAAPAPICNSLTSAGSGSAVTASTTGFVKTDFTPKCSANTYVVGTDGASYYAVGATSSKGKTKFGGSTNGGGVSAQGACATAGACTAEEATSAASSAAAAS